MAIPLITGLIMGVVVAAPFGPVSLVCVKQSLTHGTRFGIVAGFGAASAQGIFATVGVTASSAVAGVLMQWGEVFRELSAMVLVVLGLRLVLARPGATSSGRRPRGASLLATYASTLSLALANLMTILPYLALASGSVAFGSGGTGLSAWSIPGVMLGAASWYAVLSKGVSLIGLHARPAVLQPLNVLSGGALVGFGIFAGFG